MPDQSKGDDWDAGRARCCNGATVVDTSCQELRRRVVLRPFEPNVEMMFSAGCTVKQLRFIAWVAAVWLVDLTEHSWGRR
jgi:hypothetical protein